MLANKATDFNNAIESSSRFSVSIALFASKETLRKLFNCIKPSVKSMAYAFVSTKKN